MSMLRSCNKTSAAANRAEQRGERMGVGAREQEREGERDGEKPFMIKTARSQCDKLGDDTSHSTTKGENIGWGTLH